MSYLKKVEAAAKKPLIKGRIGIDRQAPWFVAYVIAEDIPGFTKEQATIMLNKQKKLGLTWKFDEAKDTFIVLEKGNEQKGEEVERVKGKDYNTVDGKKRLYLLGDAWYWQFEMDYSGDNDRIKEVKSATAFGTGKLTFRVDLTGRAFMKGTLEIKANSKSEAEKLAKEHTGDVDWNYQGMDDSTVEADAFKK